MVSFQMIYSISYFFLFIFIREIKIQGILMKADKQKT
jgi:hypothetical protein